MFTYRMSAAIKSFGRKPRTYFKIKNRLGETTFLLIGARFATYFTGNLRIVLIISSKDICDFMILGAVQ